MNQELRKNKILILIVTILLLTNIVTLIFCFGRQSRKEPLSKKGRMIEYLGKTLNYNSNQLAAYESLYKDHIRSTDSLMDDIRQDKESRLKFLASRQYSDSSIGSAARTIALKQEILEVNILNHLKKVRALGSAGQQVKFDSTFFSVMGRKKDSTKKQIH